MENIKQVKFIGKVKSFIIKNKIWSIIIVLVIVFIGYKIISANKATEIRYVTTQAVKGTILSSVSGTGQVEATSTIDLKAKASGQVVAIKVKAGEVVKKGQTLFVLDAGDAQKSLRDAELNVQIAKNDLEKSQKDYLNSKTTNETSLKNLLLALNSSVAAVADINNS